MNRSTVILAIPLGVMALLALADTLMPTANGSREVDLAASVVVALCAFVWVRVDARARNIEAPIGSALLAGLIIPIGVPVYFFRALGAREGLRATLKASGYFAVALATYLAVGYVAELFNRVEWMRIYENL